MGACGGRAAAAHSCGKCGKNSSKGIDKAIGHSHNGVVVVKCGEWWGASGPKGRLRVLAFRDANKERLLRFLERHGNTFSKLEVLLFLSHHPQARFSLGAIAGSGPAVSRHVASGLKSLVVEGVIREDVGDRDVVWYSLSTDQQTRRRVEELHELDAAAVKRYWKQCCANRC